MIVGDPALTVGADLTGGMIEPVRLTADGVKKVLLRLHKNEVAVEIRLTPAQATDFAMQLQGVLDWLGEADVGEGRR